MSQQLSKTARASLRTETGGIVSRTPVAFVFERKVGKMQTRPYATCYVRGEAEAIVAENPQRLYVVSFGDVKR
jgi:hypothetical protein